MNAMKERSRRGEAGGQNAGRHRAMAEQSQSEFVLFILLLTCGFKWFSSREPCECI